MNGRMVSFLSAFTTMMIATSFSMTGCVLPGFEEQVREENIIALATDTASDPCSAAALQAYTNQVHPTLVSKCASCHGSSQAPKFAVTDPAQGFVVSSGFVDFAAPAASKLYTKAGDGHCGSAACQGTTASAPILSGIQAWAAANAQGCQSADETATTESSSSSSSSGASSSSSGSGTGTNGIIKFKVSGSFVNTQNSSQVINICKQYEVWNTVNGFATQTASTMSVLFNQQVYTAGTCTAGSLVNSLNINSGTNYRAFYSKETVLSSKTFVATNSGNSITLNVTVVASPSPGPSTSPSPSPTSTGTPCTTDQKRNAFGATAWPILKNKCAGCHATTPGRALHASSILTTAYSGALPQGVPYNNIASSALDNNSGIDHGGCGTVNCNLATQAELLNQLQIWAQYENSTNCSSLPALQ